MVVPGFGGFRIWRRCVQSVGFGGNNGFTGTRPERKLRYHLRAAKATEVLNAAMSDPLLIDVHIGGLLTLVHDTRRNGNAGES